MTCSRPCAADARVAWTPWRRRWSGDSISHPFDRDRNERAASARATDAEDRSTATPRPSPPSSPAPAIHPTSQRSRRSAGRQLAAVCEVPSSSMDGRPLRASDVESYARRVLGSSRLVAEHQPVGFGNDNWKLRFNGDCRFVVKIGHSASEAKLNSSHLAYELASAAGLPVPELVHYGKAGDHLIRIFTWISGHPTSTLVTRSEQSTRFLQSLGEALRSLHSIRRDAFSSRLDDSAPTFPTWDAYVRYRLGQIRDRCLATKSVDVDLLDQVCAEATVLATTVDHAAEAVLSHRDLHPNNLIVSADGTLIGMIDWDAAEAWDRAGDWFKLEFELLRWHPHGANTLLDGYLQGDPIPHEWNERKRLVHLVETLNILPNAIARSWETEYSDRARSHLLELLSKVQ
ncbi:MAG: aminoglycoside phosphotransferase family protein [Actinomycetota bacterium]